MHIIAYIFLYILPVDLLAIMGSEKDLMKSIDDLVGSGIEMEMVNYTRPYQDLQLMDGGVDVPPSSSDQVRRWASNCKVLLEAEEDGLSFSGVLKVNGRYKVVPAFAPPISSYQFCSWFRSGISLSEPVKKFDPGVRVGSYLLGKVIITKDSMHNIPSDMTLGEYYNYELDRCIKIYGGSSSDDICSKFNIEMDSDSLSVTTFAEYYSYEVLARGDSNDDGVEDIVFSTSYSLHPNGGSHRERGYYILYGW